METIILSRELLKFRIIQTFLDNNGTVNREYLAQVGGCSLRSIANYITEIREEVSEVGGELIGSNNGLTLILPGNIGLDYFKNKMFRNAFSFRIMEKLFFDANTNITNVCEELMISKSTLYRISNKLKAVLKGYGLSIEINRGMKITGSEFHIQQFFCRYFMEAYSPLEWPFEGINITNLSEALISLGRIEGIHDDNVNSYENLIRIAVGLVRKKNGNIIPIEDAISFYEDIGLLENDIKNRFSVIESQLKNNDFDEYTELFYTWMEIIDEEVLNSQLSEQSEFRMFKSEVDSFFGECSKLIGVEAKNNISRYVEVLTALKFSDKYHKVNFESTHILYKDEEQIFIDRIKESNSQLYEIAWKHYERAVRIIGGSHYDNFNYYCYMLLKKFKCMKNVEYGKSDYKKNVLVYDPRRLIRNKDNINNICTEINISDCRIIFIKEYEIDELILLKYDYDLLISTESINFQVNKSVYVIAHEFSGNLKAAFAGNAM